MFYGQMLRTKISSICCRIYIFITLNSMRIDAFSQHNNDLFVHENRYMFIRNCVPATVELNCMADPWILFEMNSKLIQSISNWYRIISIDWSILQLSRALVRKPNLFFILFSFLRNKNVFFFFNRNEWRIGDGVQRYTLSHLLFQKYAENCQYCICHYILHLPLHVHTHTSHTHTDVRVHPLL